MRRLIMSMSLALIAAAFMAAYGQEDDRRVTIEDRYTRVEPAEVAMAPDRFLGSSLEIKDRFGRNVAGASIPRDAVRFGVRPETHIAFRTSAATGSNMLCFVPRRDEKAMEIMPTLVEESPITIVGTLAGRVGAESIFIVNRMFRGHVEPTPVEKMRLIVTIRSPRTQQEVQYTIPELEKFFTIRLPESNEPVHIKIEFR